VRLWSQAHIWGIVCGSTVPGTLLVTSAWRVDGTKPVKTSVYPLFPYVYAYLQCVFLIKAKDGLTQKLKHFLSPFLSIFIIIIIIIIYLTAIGLSPGGSGYNACT
jgi:hypothetical protein